MKIKNSPRKILSVLLLALAMTLATIFSIGAQEDGTETYTAAADNAITGGVLTLSSGETTGDTVTAAAGDAVTVTVTPEEGKQLVAGSLKYTAEGGGSVTDNVYGDAPEGGVDTLIPVTDNVGNFTMPSSNVLVTAQFEDLEAQPDIPLPGKQMFEQSVTDATYAATVDSLITGGALALSSDGGVTTAAAINVASGDTVTVAVTPDAGKQLVAGSLKYTPEGGSAAAINVSDNKGSFTMPAANVEVTAEFEQVPLPAKPGTPTATVGYQSVTLSWSAVAGATSYNIYMGATSTTATHELVATTDGTTYTVTGLTNGTTYYFSLGAVNAAGEGERSNNRSATPAHRATVAFTAETDEIPAAASISGVPAGDIVTVRATIDENGGEAYGFTAGFTYPTVTPNTLVFMPETFAADNAAIPGITYAESISGAVGAIRVSAESEMPMFSAAGQSVTVILKFKTINYNEQTNQRVSFDTGANSVILLCDPDVQVADLKDPGTGAFYAGNSTQIAALGAKVLRVTNTSYTSIGLVKNATANLTYQVNDAPEVAAAVDPAGSLTPNQANAYAAAKVGDIVTFRETVSLAKGQAYGFTFGYEFDSADAKLEMVTDTWATDNPGVPLPTFTAGSTATAPYSFRVTRMPRDGEPVITKDSPLVITLRFRVIGVPPATDGRDGIEHSYNSGNWFALFADPNFSSDDLAALKNPETGVFYARNTLTPAMAPSLLKTVNVGTHIWAKAVISSALTATLTPVPDAAGFTNKRVGEKATAKLTLSTPAGADVYGYAVALAIPDACLKLDTSTWVADNGIPVPTVISDNGHLRLIQESDGSTKFITGGTPRELLLRFKITNTNSATNLKVGPYNTYFLPTVFLDPGVRAFGEGGLLAGDYAALLNGISNWQDNINQQQKNFKVAASVPLANLAIRTAYDGSTAKIDASVPAKVGTSLYSLPVDVHLKLTAPPEKYLYGFAGTILYPGAYITLDQTRTLAANPGLVITFGQLDAPDSTVTTGTAQQIYVEGGDTALTSEGGELDVKLVFMPAPNAAVGTREINIDATQTSKRMVLFTDPAIRAVATGEGLTTIGYDYDNIQAAEEAGLVSIPAVTKGSIVTTAYYTSAQLANYSGGYYTITSTAQLANFAAIVNSGDNAINAKINGASIVAPASGIGTETYPFMGELIAYNTTIRTITVNRTVSGESPVAGGLVNYLGSDGVLADFIVAGSIGVSGVTGAANVGGVVGKADGGTISNVSSTVTINAADVSANVGGIVGLSNGTTITGSGNGKYNGLSGDAAARTDGGAITGGSGNTGGVVGSATGVALINCYNSGAISGSGNVGGVAGALDGTAELTQSWNTGAVTGASESAAAGGIIGQIGSEDARISNNYNLGALSGPGTLGGITGKSDVTPQRYSRNYFLDTTAESDSLFATAAGDGQIIATVAASNTAAGQYGTQLTEPDQDTDGYYLLSTPDDILWFAAQLEIGNNMLNARLLNDIDMSGETGFKGIGREWKPEDGPSDTTTYNLRSYGGIFDGQSYAITLDLRPASPISRYTGLFNRAIGATVKNLTVKGVVSVANSSATTNYSAAGIVGEMYGGSIVDCTNEAAISAIGGAAAGIVCTASSVDLIRCVNTGSVTASAGGSTVQGVGSAAGIVGEFISTNNVLRSITDCTNSGKITADYIAAGIAGKIQGSGYAVAAGAAPDERPPFSVTGCKNTGEVVSLAPPIMDNSWVSNYSYNQPTMNRTAAGIVGVMVQAELTIDECENAGAITGNGNQVAGILGGVGQVRPEYYEGSIVITNCSNSGAITSTYNDRGTISSENGSQSMYGPDLISVGGIAGNLTGGYSSSYKLPETITATGNSNTGPINAGTAAHVSAILANVPTEAQRPGAVTVSGNTTNEYYGKDATNPGIAYAGPSTDPPGGDPSDGNSPGGITPGDGTNGGSTPQDNTTGRDTSDDSRPSVKEPVGVDDPVGDTPAVGIPGDEEPVVITPGNPNVALQQVPLPAGAIENIAANPAPVQENVSTPDEATAESGNTAERDLKPPTFYEVVRETFQNNPVIVRGVLLAAVVLAGLGGYRRYRKTRRGGTHSGNM